MSSDFRINNLSKYNEVLEPLVKEIRESKERDPALQKKCAALGKKLCDIEYGPWRKRVLSLLSHLPSLKSKITSRLALKGRRYVDFKEKMARWEDIAVKVDSKSRGTISSTPTTEEEMEKAKSKEAHKNLLFTIAGIHLAPYRDSEEELNTLKDVLKDKQQFMADEGNGIKTSTASQLFTQSKHFPLMRKTIAALKESYERWDEQALNSEDLDDLQGKIRIQQQNVQALSEILTSITRKYKEADLASATPAEAGVAGKINKIFYHQKRWPF